MRIRRGTAILAPTVVLAMIAASCGGSDDGDDSGGATGGTVIYGEATDWPENIFPLIAAGNATSVANMLINVLPQTYRVMPDFTFQYDDELLTEEPTNEMVNGKQTVTYKLNPDAVWSDGDPIDVKDFQFTWQIQRSSDEADGGCPALLSTVGFERIESVEPGEDDKTVVVTYGTPFADWQSLFTLFPAHVLDQGDPAANCDVITTGWPLAEGIPSDISGAAWQIKKENIDTGNQVVVLVPNENYWGEKPKVDKLIHQAITNNPDTFIKALQNEEVQVIYPQPQLDLITQIKDLEPEVTSKTSFGLSFEHLDFNTRKPHINLLEIRQAFALAIDRQSVVEGTVGQFDSRAQVLNNRLFVNNQPPYEDNAPEQYKSQNIAEAKRLIESVGYTLGDDGIYVSPEGERLELELMTTQNNPLREDTLKLVQAQVKEAGIATTINQNPDIFQGADKPTSLEAGGFEIALFAWVSSPTLAGNVPIYHSVTGDFQGQNYTKGGNAEIDALLEQMQSASDPAQGADLANQVDTALWEGMWTLPLYQKPTFYAHDASVSGVEENSTNAGITWNSPTWSVE